MSKDKQIEDAARIVSKCITSWLNNETPKVLPNYIVEALYNAGYRRQSEGEWVQSKDWEYDYKCSSCGNDALEGRYGNNDHCTKYCPHCGAKMKGANDE